VSGPDLTERARRRAEKRAADAKYADARDFVVAEHARLTERRDRALHLRLVAATAERHAALDGEIRTLTEEIELLALELREFDRLSVPAPVARVPGVRLSLVKGGA
jgi:hypothetical protein